MNKNGRRLGVNGIYYILIVLSIISVFVPLLSTIEQLVLLILTMSVGLILYPNVIKSKPFVFIVLFVAVQLVYYSLGKGIIFNSMASIAIIFLTSVVICFSFSDLSKKQSFFLLVLLTTLFLYTNLGTLFVLLENPMAVRTFGYSSYDANDIEIARAYRLRGMFSYAVGEAHAIILPAFLAYFINSKKKILDYALLVIVIGGLIVQLMSALMTSFLLSLVFCSLLMLSILFVRSIKYSIGVLLLLIALIIPSWGYIEDLFEYNEAFNSKIEDMNDSYASGQSTGEVKGRTYRYMQSIKVCAHNPLFGFGNTPDKNVPKENMVSYHTAVFDYWGLYGAFVVFLIIAWKETVKAQIKTLDKNRKKVYRWCLYSLIALLFLKGPVSIGTNFMFSTVFLGILCVNERFKEIEQ